MTGRSTSIAQPISVLRAMLSGYRHRMVLGAALATLTVMAGMGLLGLSGWFIAATAIAGLQLSTALVFDVFMPSAGIRLLALTRTAARYGERLVTHDATLASLAMLRERLFRGWADISGARTLLRHPARALFRLTSDLDALEPLYLRLLVPAAAALGAAALAAIILGVMNLWLGLALGLWLLIIGASVSLALFRRARVPATRRALLTERLRAQAIDLVSGQTELLMTGRLRAQRDMLARTDQRLARADGQLHRLDLFAGAIYEIAGSLTLALVLLAVGALTESGQMQTAGAVLALLIALSAMEPFAALRRGALEAGRMWLAARRISTHFEAPPESAPTEHQPTSGLALCIERATVTHPDSSIPTLRDISLHLPVGKRIAVIGPSGAGKSTLLALAAGELTPCAGTVQSRPQAWLSQHTHLFQDNLRENLLLANPQATDARLWMALKTAGLESAIRARPEGLDSSLGEGGMGLSGGQTRRLALARLLLQDHQLWFLDEPTEGLDAATAADVLDRLDACGADRSWLLATHLQREAKLADQLVVLRHGRIEANLRRGSPGFAAALATLRPD